MPARVVTVTPVLGEPRVGIWCDACALPSAVDFPVYGIWSGGVMSLGICTACTECGGRQGVTPT